jgi:hypothetical protein
MNAAFGRAFAVLTGKATLNCRSGPKVGIGFGPSVADRNSASFAATRRDNRRRSDRMEWVLFVSLQWIVFGSPTQPTTQQIQPFASEELCNKAAEAIRSEINAPIPGQRVQTVGRVVCLLRKDK